MRLTRRRVHVRCSVCHDDLSWGGRTCGGCGTELHAECSEMLGRCPTLGCTGERPPRPWGLLHLGAVVFVCVVLPLGALVATTTELFNRSGQRASTITSDLIVPPAPTPSPTNVRRGEPLPNGVDPDELRRECLKMLANVSPLERTFDERECSLLADPIRKLQPKGLQIEQHAIAIELEGGTVLVVFDHSLREPLQTGDASYPWNFVAEGVWAWKRR